MMMMMMIMMMMMMMMVIMMIMNLNVRKLTSGHYARSEDSDQNLHLVQFVTKNAKFLHADNEGSDQTARMHRLVWVFVGRKCHITKTCL